MSKRVVATILAFVVMGACVTDDGNEPDVTPRRPLASPTGEDTRVIGLVGTMSGPDMWRGEDAFEGADLAVHILNRSVDEGRPPFELVTLDDEGDPNRATELVEQLAAADNTVGVVYAGPPEGLPPAEAALTQAGIPAVICYGDLYAARMLRPHIFQASPSFLWEARVITRYLLKDRGHRRIALVASRTLSGDTAVAAMKSALSGSGRPHRLFVTRYSGAAKPDDLEKKLRRRDPQSVVIEGAPSVLSDIASTYLQNRPVFIGFDLGLRGASLPPGTVVSDSYARGAHFLPIPSFEGFRSAFADWWDGAEPLGWEVRAYDAASMIGWAAQRTTAGRDIARTLERISGVRFGGLEIRFGPDDHTAVDEQTVGLWVRPRSAFRSLIPTSVLPWLPLARGFSIDGERTAILNRDWRYLFRNPPPPDAPAPRIGRMRYAVTSPRKDPIH